jgi:hypothetical protein
VHDAVSHDVVDLALANKDQELPRRDAEPSRCLADSQWGIGHLDLGGIAEPESTVERSDLVLDGEYHGQVPAVDQRIARVLERG